MVLKVDLGDERGKAVISLTVVRERTYLTPRGNCRHINIHVDTILASIECIDCHQKLCAVEWIARLAEEWQYVQLQYKHYLDAMTRVGEMERRLHQRARAKCEHCDRMTRVRIAPVTDRQLRLVQSTVDRIMAEPNNDSPNTIP